MLAALANAVNWLLRGLVAIVNALVFFLPDSPFKEPIAAMRESIGSEMLGYINYFLPVSEFLAVVSVWVPAVFLYYVVSTALRWAKTIS